MSKKILDIRSGTGKILDLSRARVFSPVSAGRAKKAFFGQITNFFLVFGILILAMSLVTSMALSESSEIFSDSFEDEFDNWSSVDSPKWDTTSGGSTDRHSGEARADIKGNTGGDDILLKNISTVGHENLNLSFWYKIKKSLEEGDHIYVEWTANGSDWNLLDDFTDVGETGDWINTDYDLPETGANNENFAFRFRAILDAGNDEFYLDDVFLSGDIIEDEPRGQISGYKWNDLDGDGIRDWNDANENGEKDEDEEYTEPGLEGWTIALIDTSGGIIEPTEAITDADGNYSFPDLDGGDYIVCEVKKPDYLTQTHPNGDTDEGDDFEIYENCNDDYSDDYARYGYEIFIEDGDGEIKNIDFGNQESAHIIIRKETYPESDDEFEFNIENDSEDDVGLDGFSLVGGDEETINVAAGTYTISENVFDIPDGMWRLAHIACEYDGESVGVSEEDGERVILDAGDTVTCTFTNIRDDITIITGYKWEDLDGDGVKEDGEPGRKNWNVALGRQNGAPFEQDGHETIPIEIVQLSLTGADGWYYLPVPERDGGGEYKVFEEKRYGWSTTNPPAAIDSFFDIEYRIDLVPPRGGLNENSFFDVFVDLRNQIEDPGGELFIQDGQTITNVDEHPLDFGNFKLVDITGFKWNDENGDGVWDKGEPGLPDVTVALGRQNGEPSVQNGHETIPIEIVALSLTGDNGQFIISNIGSGRYKLFEENRSGWQATNPAPRIDSFFDIEYRIDLEPQQKPLVEDSFFDVFVELSGQNVEQSEEMRGVPSAPLRFGNRRLLVLSEEAATEVGETSTVIIWTTDFSGTSRVIYDTVSHEELGEAPNYGYANSTGTFDEDPKITDHSVPISGLTPGTTYYYRTISAASPESVGDEGSFITDDNETDETGSGGGGGGGGGGFIQGLIIGGPSSPEAPPLPPPGKVLGASIGNQIEAIQAQIIEFQRRLIRALEDEIAKILRDRVAELQARIAALLGGGGE